MPLSGFSEQPDIRPAGRYPTGLRCTQKNCKNLRCFFSVGFACWPHLLEESGSLHIDSHCREHDGEVVLGDVTVQYMHFKKKINLSATDGHTKMETPFLLRSLQISSPGRGQHFDGVNAVDHNNITSFRIGVKTRGHYLKEKI